ncbi:pH-responsive protein 2 precursor (pH-regulated protein 2) [Scheffersomyces stipitis CBS 6054]|uniref:1,3-beta-glucanosyltransferase n=1 Tax=Scheffersomyces stipitis (strain ATCC 58785 / CBS 6054 / NBRC 10063 / NRRL Y-11545) TaxID=322104 RepID=A3GFB9_PICST|nr:pH-responsive protein 2 precursor (pH-regulated protein 2) [Scheffersomyces stipitis CBS 6054]EAZ63320.2 pH-responsive protein 2 precursor (pH-regulated protein 2) [Scheffersomyces stipitis CBS 6054]KAG2731876.1 hypothetical protein G9P44_005463 [Scheffersomyces stipitis]
MLFPSLLSSAAVGLSLLASAVADDLPAIEIVGNKFFYSNNGSQFYIKGIAYQQDTANTTSSFVDPLADAEACKRDIPYLTAVDTNVIRVYALNVTQDHTECMQLLQDAGIYVIADLSEPSDSINRDDPEWTVDLLDRYTGVVDLFANYTNILGFFAGNEVTNNNTNTDASAYVKAAVRDTKAYIKAQGYRKIPVGYSSNDDAETRVPLADYFACGSDDEKADFFGINMYEWCGSSSFKQSGYQNITQNYQDLGVPLFFSEYGCNQVQPRKFQEVGTLYSSDMTDVWSGGIVYMYFEEANNYGLVTIENGDVSTLADYGYYSSQIKAISPTSAQSSAVSAASGTSCPSEYVNWKASTDLPPTPDDSVCACANKGSGCIVDSSVDSEDYGDLFSYICENIDCGGINGNGTSGVYGAFSACSPEDKLNFVLGLYYAENGGDDSACDFSGSATVRAASTASTCSAFLKAAGASGMGTVSGSIGTTKHTGITGSDSDSETGSGSGSGTSTSTSTSSGKASGAQKQVSFDFVTKTMFVGVAFVFGMGMIMA